MTITKTVLLSACAGFVAMNVASAADLGAKKPSAASYVKECPTYGAGFFVVPGTTSCLKIIGRVRADYTINNPLTKSDDRNTFLARGYFGYDHRTNTEYGLLRTYLRGFINRSNRTTGTTLEYAFIQFGGLTAGRIGPTFEHGFGFTMDGSGDNGGFSDITSINSLGYSRELVDGFKVSFNLDAASERRTIINGGTYAGQAVPDAVLAIDYEKDWGAIKLAGATHQVNAFSGNVSKNQYGYAGTLGAKVNLPFLNKGTNVWASGTFARGANSYSGFSTIAAGQVSMDTVDATLVGNNLKLSTTYALAGGLQVFLTPTVYAGIAGNYAVYDPTGARNRVNSYVARGIVGWQPVSGLEIAAETTYSAVQAKLGTNHGQIVAATDKSSWFGRLRVQRDF